MLLLSYVIQAQTSCTDTSFTLDNSILKLEISKDEFEKNTVQVTFHNYSNDTIYIVWSLQNIFLQNDNLPALKFYAIDSFNNTSLLTNSNNNLTFTNSYIIKSILPKDEISEEININTLFGENLIHFDRIFLKYENDNSIIDGKKIFVGQATSNILYGKQ